MPPPMDSTRDNPPALPIRTGPPAIARDPRAAAAESYDLAIVGGGVHGIALLLEAGRRGLRGLLLEQGDFGGATTYNHLRTLHGGLRYLQSADLPRFFESVAERGWFLRHFPELTRPLPCLMPLYGDGLRRPSILRAALAMNDALSARRNDGLPPSHRLPAGRVTAPAEVLKIFPAARADGLKGGALWHDAVIAAPQRLTMALLRWACAAGGRALNYARATGVLTAGGQAAGLRARDEEAGEDLEFHAPVVINAAGPWGPAWLASQGLEAEGLFPGALLLWNILFERPALSDHAIALYPRAGGHVYFAHPWEGRLLVGTGERTVPPGAGSAAPDRADLKAMVADLRAAAPALGLRASDALHVYHGVLPATPSGKLTKRPGIVDHARRGGPSGLYSVAGIKFTTARRVADDLLRAIFPDRPAVAWEDLPRPPAPPDSGRLPSNLAELSPERLAALAALAGDEAVVHLSDLALRRTNLGEYPPRARALAPALAEALYRGDPARRDRELKRLEEDLSAGRPPREDAVGVRG